MSVSQDQHHRVARAAKNESWFRGINERIERTNEGFASAFSVDTWICECANETCAERLQLSVEEYEGIRSKGTRFVVAPRDEHVWLETEEVTKHCDRYWIVEKHGKAAELTELANPRTTVTNTSASYLTVTHVEEASIVAGDVTRRMLAAYEAGDLITMCAWCRRVEIDGEWFLAPRAAITAIDAQYTLSHSICEACAVVEP